jgi:hypothetical protein
VSALLFALRRDKIDILVDTRAVGCSGLSKLWPLIHLPAILCGRGPVALILDTALRSAAIAGDFDSFVEGMPASLDSALRANAANIAKLVGRDRRLEVYAAGISPSTSRATVYSYALTDVEAASARYERVDEDFLIAAPWVEEELGPMPEISGVGMSDDDLRQLLRIIHLRQVDLMNSLWAEGSAGGRRVLVTITAGSITSEIEEMGRFS